MKEEKLTLTCTLCGKNAELAVQEYQAWRDASEKLGVKGYCSCGGEVKLGGRTRPSVSIAGNATGSVIITGNNSNVFRSHGLKGDISGESEEVR